MENWVQEEDEETLDTLPKRWSAGLFRKISSGNENPVINKQMHVYVARMAPWVKGSPLAHYLLVAWLIVLYLIDGPIVLVLELSGLLLVMFASIQLSGFYSGKFTDDTEYPKWKENGAAMVSAHTGFLFLEWGTSYLFMAAFIQGLGPLAPAVLIALILFPLWGFWKLHKVSVDVELPTVEEEKRDWQCPTWQSRLLN